MKIAIYILGCLLLIVALLVPSTGEFHKDVKKCGSCGALQSIDYRHTDSIIPLFNKNSITVTGGNETCTHWWRASVSGGGGGFTFSFVKIIRLPLLVLSIGWLLWSRLSRLSPANNRFLAPCHSTFDNMGLMGLLFVWPIISAGVALSIYAGHKFGIWGFILGFLIGVAACFGILVAFVNLATFLADLFWGGIPRFPKCQNGTCSKGDYIFTKRTDDRQRHVWQCRCGKQYAKKGRKFLEVDKDGKIHPYLKWVPFTGWTQDGE